MTSLIFSTFCLVAIVALCTSEGNFQKHYPNRSSKKYDSPFRPFRNYGDADDDADDSNDSSSDVTNQTPSPNDESPIDPYFKGFDYEQKYPTFYKGYPYNPYWNTNQKGKESPVKGEDFKHMSPLKMMEMWAMINEVNKMQDSSKKEKSGFFTDLLSESKPVLIASIIPLTILLAAVAPVLINYMKANASAPVVSTTASKKDARSIEGASVLEEILMNFEKLYRSVDTSDCVQKVLCHVASNNPTAIGPDLKKATSTVANLINEDWIKHSGVKSLVKGLKYGTCESVCVNSTSIENDAAKNSSQ